MKTQLNQEALLEGYLVEPSPQDIHHVALPAAQKHLPVGADGYFCNTEMLFDVFFKSATENVSIETSCNNLPDVVGRNTIREYLNEPFDVCYSKEQENEMNAALSAGMPAGKRSGLPLNEARLVQFSRRSFSLLRKRRCFSLVNVPYWRN